MDEGSARVFVLELFPLWVLQTWCTLGLLCWLMKKNKRSLGLVSLMKVVYVAVVYDHGDWIPSSIGDRRLGSAGLLARAVFGVGRSYLDAT